MCPDQEDTLRHLLQLQTPIAGEAAAILHAKRPQSPLLEGQASPPTTAMLPPMSCC